MSSPLPYAPYQSHRRAASTASTNTVQASNVTTSPYKAQDPSQTLAQVPGRNGSASTGFVRPHSETPGAAPQPEVRKATFSRAPSSPLAKNVGGTSMAPPPLRTASSLRVGAGTADKASAAISPSQTNIGSNITNAAGSSTNGAAQRVDVERKGPEPGPSSSHLSTRRVVSSSLAVPSTSQGRDRSSHSIQHNTASGSNGGHHRRKSLSPSPLPGHGHSRSLSSTPTLPQMMSTAQRLRTSTPIGAISPSSSPSLTPSASLSPAFDPSIGSPLPHHIPQLAEANGWGYDGVGRMTPFRPGFQPKGAYRIRTDEFVAARARRKQNGQSGSLKEGESSKSRSELESQRLERRLEKLVVLYGEDGPTLTDEEASRAAPSWLPGTLRKARLQAEVDKRIREEEIRIVKWEDDKIRKACAICTTPFSLTLWKHHCRLCGRVVCSSPHLSVPPTVQSAISPGQIDNALPSQSEEAKCSSIVIADVKGGNKIKEMPRWEDPASQSIDPQSRGRGIRICKDCKDTILHRQYMLDDGQIPQYLKLYDALVSLQKEIEQSLPEFQEMVLGLQKHDAAAALGTVSDGMESIQDPLQPPNQSNIQSVAAMKAKNRTTLALQRDAAQARKQLLANFANYDLIAKRIRNLDDEGNGSLARLKMAISMQATVFLQTNMFPLQKLPKLNSSKEERTLRNKQSIPSIDSPGKGSPRKGTREGTTTPTSSRLVNGSAAVDPAEVRESLIVLEQQLGLVRQYATSAAKARKLQDASSLNASARDLEAEIERLRKQISSIG